MFSGAVLQIGLYITAIINVVLALVIFSRGYSNQKNIIFGLFTLSAALWAISIVGFYSFPDLTLGANWVTYTHTLALATALFFMFFTFYFPQNLVQGKSWVVWLPLLVFAAIVYIVISTNLIVGEISGISYQLGPLYIVFAAALSIYFFIGYYFLATQYSSAKDLIQKKQTLYVAVSGIISPTLAIIPDLVLPYFGVFSYTWLGPMFTLIMVVTLFVAMVRFQLFNIKVIATEIFASLVIIVMLAQLFLATSAEAVLITTVVLCMVAISAFLLIRSVYREVEIKEELQRLYKELEIKNARLTELDKLKSQFLSIASHDLRTPITAIRNFVSLLLDGSYGTVPPAAEAGLQQVFDRATDMTKLVETYLNVSRIEQGRMKYDFENVDFTALVRDAAHFFNNSAGQKGIALSLAISPGAEHLMAKLDRAKMNEVLANLIDNSIKYTPQGSVSLTLERVGLRARLTISDTGVGMSQKTMQNLFKLFSPGEDSKKINPSSTGVGLYISKAHVEAHKGILTASSAGEGRGSNFVVELPMTV